MLNHDSHFTVKTALFPFSCAFAHACLSAATFENEIPLRHSTAHSLTAHCAHWHVGQQQSSSTSVCLWPAVGSCSSFVLSPSILPLLYVAMYS